jgi:hypothetical protein
MKKNIILLIFFGITGLIAPSSWAAETVKIYTALNTSYGGVVTATGGSTREIILSGGPYGYVGKYSRTDSTLNVTWELTIRRSKNLQGQVTDDSIYIRQISKISPQGRRVGSLHSRINENGNPGIAGGFLSDIVSPEDGGVQSELHIIMGDELQVDPIYEDDHETDQK